MEEKVADGTQVRYSALYVRLERKDRRHLIGICMDNGMRCAVNGTSYVCLVVSDDDRLCDANDPVRQFVASTQINHFTYLAMHESVEEVRYLGHTIAGKNLCDIRALDDYIARFEQSAVIYGLPIESQALLAPNKPYQPSKSGEK